MKSTEVYNLICKTIYPILKLKGFRKTKSGMLGFYILLKEHYLVIWFQCSQDGFDIYAGSKFTIEIQISESNEIGAESVFARRIPHFLNKIDFDNIEELQNKIKDKLVKPPKTHFIFDMEVNTQKWYLSKFEKVRYNEFNSNDIWFSYFSKEDIEKWTELIESIIERIFKDFEKSDY